MISNHCKLLISTCDVILYILPSQMLRGRLYTTLIIAHCVRVTLFMLKNNK